MRRLVPLLLLASAMCSIQGCALLALPLLGSTAGSVMSSGAGEAAKAGVEHQANGVVIRTFAAPMDEVRDAAIATLARLQMDRQRDDVTSKGRRIVARAGRREADIELEPITPALTRMRLVVKGRFLSRDRATASTILAQTEETLDRQFPSAFSR